MVVYAWGTGYLFCDDGLVQIGSPYAVHHVTPSTAATSTAATSAAAAAAAAVTTDEGLDATVPSKRVRAQSLCPDELVPSR